MKNNSLLLVLCYKDPHYGRFRALVEAAASLPTISLEVVVNTEKGWLRYLEVFWKILTLPSRKRTVLLGFRGYEIFPLLRTLFWNTPFILDALVSPSISWKEEKQTRLTFFLPVIFQLEKYIYRSASAILVDTTAHKNLLAKHFAVPKERIFVLPVGAEEKLFSPTSVKSSVFSVLYYFSGQKLHGSEQLEHLLSKTSGLPIQYILIGPTSHRFAEYKNVQAMRSIPYHHLPYVIARSDLCLCGPFGDSEQAKNVITTKTFQALSMAKCVLVGANSLNQRFFSDKKNALVIDLNNEKALVAAVEWAFSHRDKLSGIGAAGFQTYRNNFSKEHRTKILQKVLTYVQDRA